MSFFNNNRVSFQISLLVIFIFSSFAEKKISFSATNTKFLKELLGYERQEMTSLCWFFPNKSHSTVTQTCQSYFRLKVECEL